MRNLFGSLLLMATAFLTPCFGQATVAPPTVRPAAITAGNTTSVTVSALVVSSGQAVLANGVNVLQVDQNGNNASVIGTLNDNGVNGDFLAGDGIFGGTITLSQATAGQIYLQLSVAFGGALRRTLSPVTSILVTGPGMPNTPQPSTTLTIVDPQTGATVICNELLVTFSPGTSQQNITSAILSVGGTLVGMLAHAARWATISQGGGSVEMGALVACLFVGIVITPIADRLRMPFAAFAFASVVSLIPGVFLFRMGGGLVALAALGGKAPPELLLVTIADGSTAVLIMLSMALGLIVPKMIIEHFRSATCPRQP